LALHVEADARRWKHNRVSAKTNSSVTFAMQRPRQAVVDVVDMKTVISLPQQSTQTSTTKEKLQT
jgi:hypothetical protein